MMMRHNGQIAIEFLIYIGVALCIIIVFLASILAISESNMKARTYSDIDDMGKSLQQEFLLASQLEDGYIRRINLPATLNGKSYNVTLGQSNPLNSYITLGYEKSELFYLIPPVNGSIIKGNNVLRKQNGALQIN
jgi:hypothetical protein